MPQPQQQLPPNIHDAINGAVRREVPRAVSANLSLIAKEVAKEISFEGTELVAYEAQATNIATVAIPLGGTVPFNTTVLDRAKCEIFRNPDGSFTVSRGIWSVAWKVMDATTTGLSVDNAVISQGVDGETDIIEIINKTATVKVSAITGAATLQAAPATQASISFVRVAQPHCPKDCESK